MTDLPIDEIIQKKLQYRFQKQLTKFATDYMRLEEITDPEERKRIANSLLEDLQLLDFENYKYGAALKSIQRNDSNNEAQMDHINQMTLLTTEELKTMEEELKKQEIVKSNKQTYNSIAKEIRLYDPKSQMQKKISQVDEQIRTIQESYREEMETIKKQEMYLRTALSSISCLVNMCKKN